MVNPRAATSVIASVLAYATTESHRARAQSAVADGARNRNRTLRVHGMIDRARAREAPHRVPGTDLDPRCGASKASTVWRQVATARELARARCRIVAIGCQAVDSGASKVSTVWRQVATAVWRQVATAVWRQEASAEEPRCRNGCQHASSWENQGPNLYLGCRRASPNF